MTKTCAVTYQDRSFWAYDESLAVILYLAADTAESPTFAAAFTPDTIKAWRVATFLGGNTVLDLNDVCADPTRRDRFVELIAKTIEQLRTMGYVDGATVESWRPLGHAAIWRGGQGENRASIEPILELANAIVGLVTGGLPRPPAGHWWLLGTASGARTIGMTDRPGATG